MPDIFARKRVSAILPDLYFGLYFKNYTLNFSESFIKIADEDLSQLIYLEWNFCNAEVDLHVFAVSDRGEYQLPGMKSIFPS